MKCLAYCVVVADASCVATVYVPCFPQVKWIDRKVIITSALTTASVTMVVCGYRRFDPAALATRTDRAAGLFLFRQMGSMKLLKSRTK